MPQTETAAGRHPRAASSDVDVAGRSGIYRLEIDLYEERVALLSRHGPPLRGYVSTDLDEGAYLLTVDRRNKRWTFQRGMVKTGLRFTVDLDGPDPFTLDYEEPLTLLVRPGMRLSSDVDSVRVLVGALYKLVDEDHNLAAAWLLLIGQPDVLLYDMIDQLWSVDPMGQHLVMALLTDFNQSKDVIDDTDGMCRVLRALESFSAKPADLHVDSFTSYVIEPDSSRPDPERNPPLSTLQIRFTYAKYPPHRSLVVYADDIYPSDYADDLPVYGPGCLRYPRWFTRKSTPRMHEAKTAVLARLANENLLAVIEQSKRAFDEISLAWTIYGLAGPLASAAARASTATEELPGSVGAAKLREAPWRWKGIQPARGGPGRWVPDWEAGANMRPEDAWYQLTAAGTPPGWGYRVNGVQFENFIDGRLIDTKNWSYWGSVGRSMRGLSSSEIALEKVAQAREQLLVARNAGVRLQWRVPTEDMARLVREGLAHHGLGEVEVICQAAERMPLRWQPKIPAVLFSD
ncbi:hypothetical protein GCM10023321_64080 [Pseudonocardia eucalypti]|uniref:Tox-REase-5 domain-containing protein n=1 Tax=Pseudonocardia eucalypti TaxID=648755 RepID=A0ABP9QXP8_9PSEU|nr:hypothetical protein [Pseudonocardia eucalypti]